MALEPFDTGPLFEALKQFSETLQREAQARLEQAAARTATRAITDYHIGPTRKINGVLTPGGTLRQGVIWGKGMRLTDARGRTGSVLYGTSGVLGAWVWSSAPHAWLYENKSKTNRGGHGRMPGFPTVKRIAPQEREAMFADLRALVEREAARV